MLSLVVEYAPWLIAMALLLACSAFFSASEAALFYLSRRDRRAFEHGNAAQQMAAALLTQPDRLLTAVLFWNLVINLAYFTLSSICSLQLERDGRLAAAGWLAFGALMAIIFFGEMLPKSLAVLHTRLLAALVGVPLAASVRALDPVLPILRTANLLSRRVLWPRFHPEPYLEVSDLERAVALSTNDAALMEQEEAVLQSIVSLSEIRVDELMRPRTQITCRRPPVALADLERMPRSGYLLITEPDNDEVAAAVPLKYLADVPDEHLERFSEEVTYVPWCTTVAAALEEMRRQDRRVVVVLNEYGETIGIVTFDDILDTVFSESPSRSARLLNQSPIRSVAAGVWHVTGMTSLRRLTRSFQMDRKPGKSNTVAGVMQEALQRVPALGDHCDWAGFRLEVIDVSPQGQLLVEMRRLPARPRPTEGPR